MKGRVNERDGVRIPDVEVLIAAAQSDVAMVCFYMGTSPHDETEVVTGISSTDEVGAVVSILQECIKALSSSDWHTLDELASGTAKEGGEPPFQ